MLSGQIAASLGPLPQQFLQLDLACRHSRPFFYSCRGNPRSLVGAGIPLSVANMPQSSKLVSMKRHSAARESKIEAQGEPQPQTPDLVPPGSWCQDVHLQKAMDSKVHWLPCPELGSAFLYN